MRGDAGRCMEMHGDAWKAHIHSIRRHPIIRPQASEERPSRVQPRAKLSLDEGAHALRNVAKQRHTVVSHVLCSVRGLWGKGGGSTLVKEAAHSTLKDAHHRPPLMPTQHVVPHGAPAWYRGAACIAGSACCACDSQSWCATVNWRQTEAIQLRVARDGPAARLADGKRH